jgi:hypothetical protein
VVAVVKNCGSEFIREKIFQPTKDVLNLLANRE